MESKVVTSIPGTRDLLPEEMPRWHLVEARAREIFERHGFQEIRTPVLEATELFARGIGGETAETKRSEHQGGKGELNQVLGDERSQQTGCSPFG